MERYKIIRYPGTLAINLWRDLIINNRMFTLRQTRLDKLVLKLVNQKLIDLTNYYSLLPNGLGFMSNTHSCIVLSRVENYFVIEPKNSKKQIRPVKHGNIIFICL